MRPASLLYAHGFVSSPDSAKAVVLRDWLAVQHREMRLSVPVLPMQPAAAMAVLEAELARLPKPLVLMGSSLGGYYCAALAARSGWPVVLINPLADPLPYRDRYVGTHENPCTGERFAVTAQDAADLLALQTPCRHPARQLLLLQTGDETLDYRQAIRTWPACPRVVINGGHHGFDGFRDWLPFVLEFFAFALTDSEPPA